MWMYIHVYMVYLSPPFFWCHDITTFLSFKDLKLRFCFHFGKVFQRQKIMIYFHGFQPASVKLRTEFKGEVQSWIAIIFVVHQCNKVRLQHKIQISIQLHREIECLDIEVYGLPLPFQFCSECTRRHRLAPWFQKISPRDNASRHHHTWSYEYTTVWICLW